MWLLTPQAPHIARILVMITSVSSRFQWLKSVMSAAGSSEEVFWGKIDGADRLAGRGTAYCRDLSERHWPMEWLSPRRHRAEGL